MSETPPTDYSPDGRSSNLHIDETGNAIGGSWDEHDIHKVNNGKLFGVRLSLGTALIALCDETGQGFASGKRPGWQRLEAIKRSNGGTHPPPKNVSLSRPPHDDSPHSATMKYELTDLRLFHAITEAQSLAAGAARMHLSPPSASYRLKNLEQAVGAALFVRGPRGMDLTPAGQVLLEHVRTLLGSLERMHGDVARFANGVKGHIRLVCNSSCLAGLTAPLARFLAVHPNINVDLEERLSKDIGRAVAEGAADIGLLAGDVDVAPLAALDYARDELVLVAAPQHRFATASTLPFAATLDADFVALGHRSSNTQFLLHMAGKLGRRLNVRVNVDSFAAVLHLVAENVGVSIVPRSVATPHIEAGRLACVTLDEAWAQRNQRIVAIDFAQLPSFVREFVDDLVQLSR